MKLGRFFWYSFCSFMKSRWIWCWLWVINGKVFH